MDCINMAVGEQGGIELRRLFGVAIEPQAWGYARHVNFPPKSERRGGPGGSLLSYHCGDRPRACGRRERERARTQIGTEQNATALPSRTLPKSAARLSPPKEREFLRTWSPSIAEVCYRRRGPAAAPMNADAEPPAGLAIIGCPLPSCLACRRSLLTEPTAAAQPFAELVFMPHCRHSPSSPRRREATLNGT